MSAGECRARAQPLGRPALPSGVLGRWTPHRFLNIRGAHRTSRVNLRIEQATANGTITKEQADKIKAATAGRVAELVDAVRGGKGPLGRPGATGRTAGR